MIANWTVVIHALEFVVRPVEQSCVDVRWLRSMIVGINNKYLVLKAKLLSAKHLVHVEKDADTSVRGSAGSPVPNIPAKFLWLRPCRVVTRLRCHVASLLMMHNVLLLVKLSYRAVTNALELVGSASKGDHMKYAKIRVTVFSFVHTVVKQHAAGHAHLVLENAVDVALTVNAPNSVYNHADHA